MASRLSSTGAIFDRVDSRQDVRRVTAAQIHDIGTGEDLTLTEATTSVRHENEVAMIDEVVPVVIQVEACFLEVRRPAVDIHHHGVGLARLQVLRCEQPIPGW